MNKKEYLKQRNEMVNALEGLVAAGLSDADFEAKKKEIEDLDTKFENASLQAANLESLKEPQNVNLQNIKSAEEGNLQMKDKNPIVQAPQMTKEEMQNVAFAKAVMGKPLSDLEMQNVEYAADNQILIPTTLLNEIIGDLSTLNPFFGDARKFNVKGNLNIPKHVRIVAGDAQFQDEKVDKVVQDNEFETINLGAKEISKLIEVSFQMEAMSIDAFNQFLRKEIVDRVSTIVGAAVYTGNGTTEFEGVVTALTGTDGEAIYTAGELTYGQLTAAMGQLSSKSVNGAAWYASSKTVWAELANILDGQGRPMFIADATGSGVGRLFGLPVKVDDGAPEGVIVLGNATRGYAINTNQSLSVQTDKDLKRRVNQYLAYALMDGAVTDESALVVLRAGEVVAGE